MHVYSIVAIIIISVIFFTINLYIYIHIIKESVKSTTSPSIPCNESSWHRERSLQVTKSAKMRSVEQWSGPPVRASNKGERSNACAWWGYVLPMDTLWYPLVN